MSLYLLLQSASRLRQLNRCEEHNLLRQCFLSLFKLFTRVVQLTLLFIDFIATTFGLRFT